MKMTTILKASQRQLSNMGFEFVWAYSAHRCCVHYNGTWIGSFNTEKKFAIPRREIADTMDMMNILEVN